MSSGGERREGKGEVGEGKGKGHEPPSIWRKFTPMVAVLVPVSLTVMMMMMMMLMMFVLVLFCYSSVMMSLILTFCIIPIVHVKRVKTNCQVSVITGHYVCGRDDIDSESLSIV